MKPQLRASEIDDWMENMWDEIECEPEHKMTYTNKQVRKALQGSIQKWEKIVAGTGADIGINNCPLCKLFYEHDCQGCPVQVASGYPTCNATPYVPWSGLTLVDFPAKADTPMKVAAAKRELQYLKNLDKKFFEKGVTVK